MSTSSVSRSEFFDLRSLNNLVSHLLILSKQNVLRTYGVSMRFSQPWRSTFHQTSLHCVYFLSPDLPQSFSVEMEFEYIWHRLWICLLCNLYWCDASRHSVHFSVPFRNMCTLPRLIQTLCLQLAVCSLACLWQTWHKIIRWYKFTRCKMDLGWL